MARSKHMLNNYGEIWRSLAYRVSIQGMVITTSPSPDLEEPCLQGFNPRNGHHHVSIA